MDSYFEAMRRHRRSDDGLAEAEEALPGVVEAVTCLLGGIECVGCRIAIAQRVQHQFTAGVAKAMSGGYFGQDSNEGLASCPALHAEGHA